MADTYRPLRADDPVGTEVWHAHGGARLGPIICIHKGWAWVDWSPKGPGSWEVELLRVRVPDPWGELLAKAIKLNREVSNLEHLPPQLNGAFNEMTAAIAAVEAAKKGASDAAK